MKVLFIHENTLGHGSYLPPFVEYFRNHPELEIDGEILNATPLPAALAKKADLSIPFLRRFGLDQRFARWRRIASKHVRDMVKPDAYDAIVVNTQSIALDLIDLPRPLVVALDATFTQLAQSRWFGEPPASHLGPRLIAELIQREARLFQKADVLLPWSTVAAAGLADSPAEKIRILPPSVEIPPPRQAPRNPIPRALFVGGDFKRKGGEILLEVFRTSFRGRLELDIVTETKLPGEPGVRVHRSVQARSGEWKSLWDAVDFFVFPSRLETFGIVLVEAMAFGVPIISSRAGAADEILEDGKAGLLLKDPHAEDLITALEVALGDASGTRDRAEFGRRRADSVYNLKTNSERLAGILKALR